jgi:hypothetical protein
MTRIEITAGPYRFVARLEEGLAPKTCARFRELLPYRERIIHVRWSGEGCWIPLGSLDLGLAYENHTSYPAPGHFILYPGSAKPKSCSPMAAFISPARWGSWPATTSSRSSKATNTWPTSAA